MVSINTSIDLVLQMEAQVTPVYEGEVAVELGPAACGLPMDRDLVDAMPWRHGVLAGSDRRVN